MEAVDAQKEFSVLVPNKQHMDVMRGIEEKLLGKVNYHLRFGTADDFLHSL